MVNWEAEAEIARQRSPGTIEKAKAWVEENSYLDYSYGTTGVLVFDLSAKPEELWKILGGK